MVKPSAFLIIELSTALAATRQVEQTDQIIHAHHLLIVTRIPTQQSKEVYDSLGEVATLTIAR
jgi:hypothetical protein